MKAKSELSHDIQSSDQEKSVSGKEKEDIILEALTELCSSLLNIGDGVRVVVRVKNARPTSKRRRRV
jgi:hypothetical protein